MKTHTLTRVMLFGAALSLMPALASGQGLCDPKESVLACLERLADQNKVGEKKAGEMKEASRDKNNQAQNAVKKTTETGLGQMNGLSSSVKDFLPLLQAAGLLGPVQTDKDSGAVSVALNIPFLDPSGGVTKDPSFQLKAVIQTTPRLFDGIRKVLPEKDRDALEKALLAGSETADNYALHASYNVSSRTLGRTFAQHAGLLNQLFEQAVSGVMKPSASLVADLFRNLRDHLGDDVSFTTTWGEIPAARRQAAEPTLRLLVEQERSMQEAFSTAVSASGINYFGQLVNNQPQLSASVSRTFRDARFGPELFSGRVTYEMGLGNNLNAAFRAFDVRRCRDDAAACLDAYARFVADPATKAAIKAGSRLAVYAEFVQNSDYRFANAEHGVELSMAKGTGWSAGLDYGRLVGVNDAGAADGRIDASVRFERPGDARADTRFVASVTITKKVGEVSIPLGLVYANKERYLTDVDRGLSAHVGLRFDLFKGLK